MRYLGRVVGVLLVIAVPAGGAWYLYSRTAGRPTERPPAFEAPPLWSGVPEHGLTFVRQGKHAGTDIRGFDHLALYVPAGEAASDFLAPGPFTATFKGRLNVPTRDRYRFTCVGTGEFEMTVGDATVVVLARGSDSATGKRLRLKKGAHEFTARYTSPASGPAILRVYWESSEFGREPIAPRFLDHDESAASRQYRQLRRGRELARGLRCGSCHVDATAARPSPSLLDAGTRLRRDWLAAWIADPSSLRPSATMPKLLRDDSAAADARDIAAYLVRQGTPGSAPEFRDDERQTGAEFFADYGCIACHTLPGHGDANTVADRIPLAFVKAKWHPAALIAFLQKPSRHHPGIRMPDFGFDLSAARAVAAFLLSRPGRSVPAVNGGDAVRGEQLIASQGCATCHGLPVASTMTAPDKAVTREGSIECRVAKYALADEDRQALREFLTRGIDGRRTPIEFAQQVLADLRCVHCHSLRGRASVLSRVQDETAAVVESDPAAEGAPVRLPPDLTFAGSKLRSVSHGRGGASISPRNHDTSHSQIEAIWRYLGSLGR